MNTGVGQSNNFALEQLLGIRLETEPAPFQNHDLVASPKEFFCDHYASRSGANDADISRDASPVIEFVEILNHLARTSARARRAAGSIHWARLANAVQLQGKFTQVTLELSTRSG